MAKLLSEAWSWLTSSFHHSPAPYRRLAEHCLRQAAPIDVIRVAGTFAAARHISRAASSEPLVASPVL
jgi:hypothetical protein